MDKRKVKSTFHGIIIKTYSGKECRFSQRESDDSDGSCSFIGISADASDMSSCTERDGGELVKSIVSCSKMVASSDILSFNFD
jgi:hypothetical protein